MARSNYGDGPNDPTGQGYNAATNSQPRQQEEHFNDSEDDQRYNAPPLFLSQRPQGRGNARPARDDESGDDNEDGFEAPQSRRHGRRSILYNPREVEEDVIQQIEQHQRILAWGVRFCRMIEEYYCIEAANTFTIWDSDTANVMRQMLSRQIFKSSIANRLVALPRARVSHLKYLPWWREECAKAYELYQFDDQNQAKLITVRRPNDTLSAPASAPRVPVPQDNMSEGSDDDSASRRHRGATVDTTQSTGDLSKKIRKETLGIFDPDNPDDKDNQGLITTSSGKTIYTDVFMFCEHLSVFKRFGEYSLTDYYVGMLSGKASAWLMSELDSPSRNRLLNLPITEFGRKLTERFKRPDTDILNELHSSRYTPKVAARGITLAQWAQRKAGLAKQIGHTQDSTIITTLFNKIDIEIQRFLTYPSENTSLTSFIRQCEQRRTTIEQFCRSNDRGDRNDQRYKSGYSSSRDKGSRSDRRSRDESSSSRRRDDYDRSKRDDRYRSDRPSRSYTDARKSDDKHGERRHDGNRNRHTHSRDNDYMRKDVKEEKKVHWERKYPVMEEEDELGPDKVDTDGDSESVCSSRSTSSEEAYLTYMTGNTSHLDGQKELFCGTCQRSFPSRAVLWEHSLARTCVKPAQLAGEQAPAKSKRCNHCRRDFLSRNRLHRHLKTGCASQMMTASESGNALQVNETTVTSANETSARAHHRPQVCEVDGNYTHLKFDAMSSPGGETVSVCADTGCGKPVISREWLQTLDHTIEQKTPVFIRGVNDKVGKPHTEWATFTFYVNGLDKNGADAGLAEYTCGAWVQDGMPSSSPRALLGNGWMAPYGINVMTTDRRLHCTSLEDFYIPFTISQLSRRVSRRVIVARPTTVPAGQTRLVPASWKEVPKGRTFMFNGCVAEASDALISSDTAPGVVIVNNSDKDITFQRKQKLGNIEECEEDEMYFSSTWKAAALALLATAGMATTGTSGGAIDVANVKISSEIDLTPEISAVATGEIVPRAINTPQVSISGMDNDYTTTNAIRDVGSAILEDIKEAELPYKQQKKNKKKQPLSKVAELLSNQPAASAATGSALPLIGEPEATVSESVPTTPYVPYQVHVQKQPNLPEIVTQDGIHIYDDGSGFARQAQDLCAKYATLWIDSGLIHVPEDELMTVPLVDNWHEQRVSQRPYACGLKDRNLIDQIFDRLHDQKRMEWFPRQLAALEQYIGATGYIRHLIPYYAKIMEPLQKRKVALLAEGRRTDKIVDGNRGKRKSYTKNTYYDPTPAEKIAFQTIQEQIASGRGLVHLDPKKRLFLQLDASIQRGFGAVLYHVKDGYIWKEGTQIPSNVVMPICFISRTLSGAETRYGPTELEMAALVWAMKRLKAHVGSSEGSLTVFTDHSATKQIVEKTTLDTTSTDRANRRLVNASIYLSEYDLRVFHIPGKKNFIPDALSRLEAPETDENVERLRPDYTALDDVCVGVESLMSQETRDKFIQGYIDDVKYLPILKMILGADDKPVDANRLNGEDAVSASKRGVPFALKDGLLYHEQTDGYLRLCVPHAMIDEILKMAHDDQHHFGTERMTRELSGLSIHNLTTRIRKHIHGCKTCCLGQTDRQQRIGNYMPIRPPVTPMHTIAIDFITDLPPVPSARSPWAISGFDLYDQLMTVTCAASKRCLLVPGYSTAHEFIYGFKPMSALDTVTPMEDVADLPYLREVTRKEARLAMDFAAMKGKRWYDDKHRPITLKQGDRVYLRLHDGYHLPGKPSKKWSQQRTGPFLIKRVVNDLAYELEIPEQWKIHPVISVKHLVPAHANDHIDEQPGPVEGEPVDENRYEVDFIVKREVRRRGRNATPFEGFLVRWKGWGPEHDQWVKTADMDEELVESFRKKHPEQFNDEPLRKSGRKKRIPAKLA
ncbi:unnamed protein product [Fusarium fujikuroi]|nr:unnamed protein product [Fusarium fujikuroi]